MRGSVWLTLLLVLLVPREALATGGTYATIDAAYSACLADIPTKFGLTVGTNFHCEGPDYGLKRFSGCRTRPAPYNDNLCQAFYGWTTGCPAGQLYSTSTRLCYDPDAACALLIKDTEVPGTSWYNPESAVGTRTYGTACIGGCTMACLGECTNPNIGGAATGWHGHFGFTGKACAVVPESPPPAVLPLKTSQSVCNNTKTFCVRQDGKYCYAASTGRQICYSPLETGTKTDRQIAQVRCAGTGPCTAPAPPLGSTLATTGTPVTVTDATTSTTVDGSTHTTTSTTTNTSTTTTQNYTTNYGTSAGSSDQGEPGGTPSSGDPVGGTTGAVSGDGSCTTQYVVTGGDPVANKVLEELHASNCAARDEYTYQGDGLQDLVDSDDGGGQVTASDAYSDAGVMSLDQEGFAGSTAHGACPVLPTIEMPSMTVAGHEVGGQVWHIDQTAFCEYGSWLGWLFVGLALVWGIEVVFG
jgi:hypothetical protein